MSRNGATRTTSDYENRYGRLSVAAQHALKSSIQQFDEQGNFVPELTNTRGFQVLASLDFYTTLGTGKIGGNLFAGTSLDVGYTENSPHAATRLPTEVDDPAWRILTRAFTEGQKTNPNRATVQFEVLDNEALYNLNNNEKALYLKVYTPDTQTVIWGATQLVLDYGVFGSALSGPNYNSFVIEAPTQTQVSRKFELVAYDVPFTPTMVKAKSGYLSATSCLLYTSPSPRD